MMKHLCFLFFVLILPFRHALSQGAGVPDPTFNGNGYWLKDYGFNDNLTAVQVLPNQKIVVTGVALSPVFQGNLIVARLNPDGTPDTTFGNNGTFQLALSSAETYGYAVRALPDGKLMVGGVAISLNTGYSDVLLLRLDDHGNMDQTFGSNGITVHNFTDFDDFLQDMQVQPDGKIVVSGTVSEISGFDLFNTPAIMRFTADGQLDPGFGEDGLRRFPAVAGDNELTTCMILPDGGILASGHYQNVFTGASDFDLFMVKVDQNGTPDTQFGTDGRVIMPVYGGIDDAFGMDIDQEGRIVLGGFTTQPVTLTFDMVLARFLPNGTIDATFGENGLVLYDNTPYDVCNDVVIQPDGKIIALGGTGDFLFPKSFAIWRYLPDGSPDIGFGTNGLATYEVFQGSNHEFNAVTLQEDGKIVAAGKALNLNNDAIVMRFEAGTSTVNEAILSAPPAWIAPQPAAECLRVQVDHTVDMNNASLRIFNLTGQLVATTPLVNGRAAVPLAPGLYTFHIQTPNRIFTGKAVVN